MNMNVNRSIRIAAAVAVSAGLAWPLFARQTDPPLSGPAVKDRNVPGAGNTFGDGMPMDPAKRAGRVQPRLFFEAVRELAGDGAPEGMRLTEEQAEQCRAIAEEFRAAAQAFQREHREEIRALREKAGEAVVERRGRGDPPPPANQGERKAATPEQQAFREQLRELMQKGPKPDPYFARIWEVLDDEQEAFVRRRVEQVQTERMMERGGPIAREAVRQKMAEADPRLKELQGLSRREIRERLRELPPEERERILAKLREYREQRGGGGGRRVEDKPPPSVDDVDVPGAPL